MLDRAEQLLQNVETYGGLSALTSECGGDMTPFVGEIQILNENMYAIETNVDNAVTLTGCSKISSILRRIFHGAACDDAIDGLTWMFAALLSISVLGMIMITL